MAICTYCEQEMTSGASCTVEAFHLNGQRFDLDRYGAGPNARRYRADRCGDCGVARGGFHHPGCDLQTCPRCFGQMFSCGCRFDEDGPECDDDDDEIDSAAVVAELIDLLSRQRLRTPGSSQ